jgi:hypothetical protein
VILEDDESNIPSVEAAVVYPSVDADAGADVALALPKSNSPPSQVAWYDVEDGCYIYDNVRPSLLLKQVTIVSSTPQEQPYSQDYLKQPEIYALSPLLVEDNRAHKGLNVSGLGNDAPFDLGEQGDTLSATHHCS